MNSAKEYAKENNVKMTQHRDGTVTIKFERKYQNGDFNNFNYRMVATVRGMQKRLGMKYVPSNKTYNWYQFKDKRIVKVKAHFKGRA